MPATCDLLCKVRQADGTDRFGNTIYAYKEPILIPGCLIAPAAAMELSADRPEGVTVKATAYVPRGYASLLTKAQVLYPGTNLWLTVIGEPMEYPEELLPKSFPWAAQVLLGDTHG